MVCASELWLFRAALLQTRSDQVPNAVMKASSHCPTGTYRCGVEKPPSKAASSIIQYPHIYVQAGESTHISSTCIPYIYADLRVLKLTDLHLHT